MEPGAGADRRLLHDDGGVGQGRVFVVAGALGVPLLHQTEAAKLALLTVKEAVVVGVLTHESPAGDGVKRLHLGQAVDRERQACGPGAPGGAVVEIEGGARRVGETHLTPQAVVAGGEQPRLASGEQAELLEGHGAGAQHGAHPDEAGGAVAVEVGDLKLLGA